MKLNHFFYFLTVMAEKLRDVTGSYSGNYKKLGDVTRSYYAKRRLRFLYGLAHLVHFHKKI